MLIIVNNSIINNGGNIKNCSQNFYNEIKDYNNIIAFTGDRGVGKTSAMVSFTNAIKELYTYQDDSNSLDEILKLKE